MMTEYERGYQAALDAVANWTPPDENAEQTPLDRAMGPPVSGYVAGLYKQLSGPDCKCALCNAARYVAGAQGAV